MGGSEGPSGRPSTAAGGPWVVAGVRGEAAGAVGIPSGRPKAGRRSGRGGDGVGSG